MEKSTYRPKAKHWAGIVIPNYTPLDEMSFAIVIKPLADYYVYGREVGADGLKHLQAMVCFKKQMYLSQVKKLIPTQGHWEIKHAKSTMLRASNYCKKGEQSHAEWEIDHEQGIHFGLNAFVVEEGVLPIDPTEAGRGVIAANYQETLVLAREGRMDEINAEHYIKVFSRVDSDAISVAMIARYRARELFLNKQYYATIKKIGQDSKNLILPKDLEWKRGVNCPNQWIYGKAGVGKSRRAREDNPGFYTKMMSELWEGYDGQEVVLLEDMDPYHVKLGYHLKIWADRYSFRGRVLYGSITLRPQKIVVTSQYHPNDIWGADSKTAEAICDRFNIIHLEALNKADDSIPRKKPALKRSKGNGLLDFVPDVTETNFCLQCNMIPCLCEELLDVPGYLLSEVIITESDEEENNIIIED